MIQLFKPRLKALLERYLQAKARKLSSSTISITRRAMVRLTGEIGNLRINKVTSGHIEKFQSAVIDFGNSPATANIAVKSLRPIFRWAVREKIIQSDPFANVSLLKTDEKQISTYSIEQFKKVLDACPDDLWRARLLMGKTTGMRRGEVLNLTIDNIDFENMTIEIKPKKNSHIHWAWQPKNRKVRKLPLVSKLADLLTKLLLSLPANQPYLLLSAKNYARNIRLKDQGKLSPLGMVCPDRNFNHKLKEIMQRAGVTNRTFHDLRRTFATEMVNSIKQKNGLNNLKDVMRLTGHSDVETLIKHYLRSDDSVLDIARTVGATGLEPATS